MVDDFQKHLGTLAMVALFTLPGRLRRHQIMRPPLPRMPLRIHVRSHLPPAATLCQAASLTCRRTFPLTVAGCTCVAMQVEFPCKVLTPDGI